MAPIAAVLLAGPPQLALVVLVLPGRGVGGVAPLLGDILVAGRAIQTTGVLQANGSPVPGKSAKPGVLLELWLTVLEGDQGERHREGQ